MLKSLPFEQKIADNSFKGQSSIDFQNWLKLFLNTLVEYITFILFNIRQI